MQKKSQDFSMEEVMRLANSPAGQQLFTLLQHKDSAAVQQAARQASQGEDQNAGQTLSALLSSPEVQALIRQLGR